MQFARCEAEEDVMKLGENLPNWKTIKTRRNLESMNRMSAVIYKTTIATIVILATLLQSNSLKATNCTRQLSKNSSNNAAIEFGSAPTRAFNATATLSELTPTPLRARSQFSDDATSSEAPGGVEMKKRQATSSSSFSSSDSSSFDEYLDSLPITSVGQEHKAIFECDISAGEANKYLVVWVKLINNKRPKSNNRTGESGGDDAKGGGHAQAGNDITPLSLNDAIITPDKRLKVYHRPPSRWVLTIDNVGQADDKAYYLCQVTGPKSAATTRASAPSSSSSSSSGTSGEMATNFVGGARLSVLVPPRIIANETSASQVSVNEFEPFKLTCKVVSELQSQITWRREDGKGLDGLNQRFKHQFDRSQPNRLLSIDSSELVFETIRREQAGAYLCIASNGVQPGVSQRMSVVVDNCRESEEAASKIVPCDQAEAEDRAKSQLPDNVDAQDRMTNERQLANGRSESSTKWVDNLSATTSQTSTAATTTTTLAAKQVPSTKPKWKLTSMSTSSSMNKLRAGNDLQEHLQQQPSANRRAGAPNGNNQTATAIDKSRQSRLHKNYHNKNDRAGVRGTNNKNSNDNSRTGSASSSSSSFWSIAAPYRVESPFYIIQTFHWPPILLICQQLAGAIYTVTRRHWSVRI